MFCFQWISSPSYFGMAYRNKSEKVAEKSLDLQAGKNKLTVNFKNQDIHWQYERDKKEPRTPVSCLKNFLPA